MSPDVSRRAARVMERPAILALTFDERAGFCAAVDACDGWGTLAGFAKELIIRAENQAGPDWIST